MNWMMSMTTAPRLDSRIRTSRPALACPVAPAVVGVSDIREILTGTRLAPPSGYGWPGEIGPHPPAVTGPAGQRARPLAAAGRPDRVRGGPRRLRHLYGRPREELHPGPGRLRGVPVRRAHRPAPAPVLQPAPGVAAVRLGRLRPAPPALHLHPVRGPGVRDRLLRPLPAVPEAVRRG